MAICDGDFKLPVVDLARMSEEPRDLHKNLGDARRHGMQSHGWDTAGRSG